MSNPPGWYPDHSDASRLRYWDGNVWTEHTAPAGPSPAGPAMASPMQRAPGQRGNWFVRHKILSGVLALVLLLIIAGAVGGGGSDDDDTSTASDDSAASAEPSPSTKAKPAAKASEEPVDEPSQQATEGASKEPEPKPEPKVIKVTAAKILQQFEDNEAAADLQYGDHQLLEVSGFVSKVDTELFHDDRYVINVSGPDYEYAFATVNCDGQSAEDVASIKVGQKITVGGDFQDGGDLGVELGGCHIV
jgi:hypothetical protein